jgi:hypothetical protein
MQESCSVWPVPTAADSGQAGSFRLGACPTAAATATAPPSPLQARIAELVDKLDRTQQTRQGLESAQAEYAQSAKKVKTAQSKLQDQVGGWVGQVKTPGSLTSRQRNLVHAFFKSIIWCCCGSTQNLGKWVLQPPLQPGKLGSCPGRVVCQRLGSQTAVPTLPLPAPCPPAGGQAVWQGGQRHGEEREGGAAQRHGAHGGRLLPRGAGGWVWAGCEVGGRSVGCGMGWGGWARVFSCFAIVVGIVSLLLLH